METLNFLLELEIMKFQKLFSLSILLVLLPCERAKVFKTVLYVFSNEISSKDWKMNNMKKFISKDWKMNNMKKIISKDWKMNNMKKFIRSLTLYHKNIKMIKLTQKW